MKRLRSCVVYMSSVLATWIKVPLTGSLTDRNNMYYSNISSGFGPKQITIKVKYLHFYSSPNM